jgi:HTH-type transcriptional regulator/antitoxin HigA
MKVTKEQYEYAQNRVEELLPLVSDEMSANHPLAVELALMSDVVIAYEKEHFSIDTLTES